MRIKMELLSDVIFGNGMSIPGAEDISVLCDEYGFPYYKGGTFKGLLREEYKRYALWCGMSKSEVEEKVDELFGNGGSDDFTGKMVFSDFVISPNVKKRILEEVGYDNPDMVTDILTNIRSFTKITEEGVAQKGSLRMARCVNKGLFFYSEIICDDNATMISEVIQSIKWIGSMRNRGFGKVRFTVEEE